MIYLTTTVLLLLLLFSILKEKNVYNPLSIFLAMWFVICFLASLQLFDMYDYSYRAPLVILIGVIGYYLGFMIARKYKIKSIAKLPIIGFDKSKEYEVREKLYIILLIIPLAVYATMAISVVGLLASGYSASTIRELYRDSGETALSGMASSLIYGSKLLKQLDSYAAKPIVLASIPLLSIDIAEKGKITKTSLLAIISLGLSMFVTFGRINLFLVIVSIICVFLIRKRKLTKKTKRRIKYIAIVIFVAVAVFFTFLSNVRSSGSNSNTIQNIYAYFSIPVPLLDYWMEHVNDAEAYSLGFSFISGIVANIMNVLARLNIFIEPYKVCELYNYNLVDHFVSVFPTYRYNAYVSMFFAFYLDFREFGVLFGSMTFGYIVSRSYRRAKENSVYLAFYLLLLQTVLWSFVRWNFVIVSYCFSFIVLRLLFGEKKTKQ